MVKIVVGAVVGVAAVVYLGFSVYFMNHFYFNTKINGVNFSGKSVSAVESYMKSQVDGYVLTMKESDGTEEKIAGTDISLAYKAGNELQKLVKRTECISVAGLPWKDTDNYGICRRYI